MADQFLGEIRAVGFTFAPQGWAECDGQLMAISQSTALFSLLGTYYGGDGRSNFGLPNLQGNVALGQGQGPGLSDRFLGEVGGSAEVTLLSSEMPAHKHTVNGQAQAANNGNPSGAAPAIAPRPIYAATTQGSLAADAVQSAGSGSPHNNLMPTLVVNFVIALTGIFPARG